MIKQIVTAIAAIVTIATAAEARSPIGGSSGPAGAYQACGPTVNFNVNSNESNGMNYGDNFNGQSNGAFTSWNESFNDTKNSNKSLGFTIGLTWTIGQKKACDANNARVQDAELRAARQADAQARQAEAAATQAEVAAIRERAKICGELPFTTATAPQSIKDLCGDLLPASEDAAAALVEALQGSAIGGGRPMLPRN